MTDEIDTEAEKPTPNIDVWPKKETKDHIRDRFTTCHKWLNKAMAVVKSKKPEEINLKFWINEEGTIACPASWCGLDPEFQEAGFILKIPNSYQTKPERLPTFIVRGTLELITAAAISEFFELYNLTNGGVPHWEIFGYVGESSYDVLIDDDATDQQRFIERAGLYLRHIEDMFEENFEEPLLTKL